MFKQYSKALESGYSDQEIAEYLSKDNQDDYKRALNNGYSDGEIARYLSGFSEKEWQYNITRQDNR